MAFNRKNSGNNNNNSNESKPIVASFWAKTSNAGKQYMTGVVKHPDGSETQVVMFENNNKKSEKSPDFLAFESEPREGQGNGGDKSGGYQKSQRQPQPQRQNSGGGFKPRQQRYQNDNPQVDDEAVF